VSCCHRPAVGTPCDMYMASLYVPAMTTSAVSRHAAHARCTCAKLYRVSSLFGRLDLRTIPQWQGHLARLALGDGGAQETADCGSLRACSICVLPAARGRLPGTRPGQPAGSGGCRCRGNAGHLCELGQGSGLLSQRLFHRLSHGVGRTVAVRSWKACGTLASWLEEGPGGAPLPRRPMPPFDSSPVGSWS
jgi:hypothetical protein